MKETLKNFLAMVIATAIWALGFSIPVSIYFLFENGPSIEECILLASVTVLFAAGIFLSKKNLRIKTALEFPLFPQT